jgi:hypothetical protein
LYEIVIAESPKAYLTKEVDMENKNGFFSNYKSVCDRISSIIKELNPTFKYAKTLASTIVESANQQRFFALHLPGLTNIDSQGGQLDSFFRDLILNTVKRTKSHGK